MMGLDRPTTVISVRGRDRAALLADPSFVYVGRRCAGWIDGGWGNPFKPGMDPFAATRIFEAIPDEDFRCQVIIKVEGPLTLTDAVRWYEGYIYTRCSLWDRLPELRGKVLGCWCGAWKPGEPDLMCHAVVLAKLADSAAQA